MIVLGAMFTNFVPFIISKAIDEIKNHPESASMLNFALITVGSSILSGVFLYFTRQTIIVVSREIENDLTRTVDIVPMVVAKGSRGRCRECSRVVPLRDRPRSGAWIADLVRIQAARGV